MSKQWKISQEQLEREKAVYLYFNALERGDFATMTTVLQQAQNDHLLEQMILEIHEHANEEDKIVISVAGRERILELVLRHLPSGIWDVEEELAIPPLTVGEVMTRLQEDARVPGASQQEIKSVSERLQNSQLPLPEKLNLKNVYLLFEQLSISVSTKVQKLFRDKAIHLSMAREQGIAQLAATRRQQRRFQQSHSPKEGEKPQNDQ